MKFLAVVWDKLIIVERSPLSPPNLRLRLCIRLFLRLKFLELKGKIIYISLLIYSEHSKRECSNKKAVSIYLCSAGSFLSKDITIKKQSAWTEREMTTLSFQCHVLSVIVNQASDIFLSLTKCHVTRLVHSSVYDGKEKQPTTT